MEISVLESHHHRLYRIYWEQLFMFQGYLRGVGRISLIIGYVSQPRM
jgi:hypothetical protein